MFSMTAFLVMLGLFGQLRLAADVGIVQAATLAIFFAFSANARNLILRDKEGNSTSQLLMFRLYTIPLLSFASCLLSIGITDVEGFIVFVLIARRCSEWIAELHISESERIGNLSIGYRFILIQTLLLIFIILTINQVYSVVFITGLTLWAFSPIFLSIHFVVSGLRKFRPDWSSDLRMILPHLGSSWVIGLTTYLFRLTLISLVNKSVAGVLFSAYAAGGMLNSVYTYALGPSLVSDKNRKHNHSTNRTTFVILVSIALIGLAIAFLAGEPTIKLAENEYRTFFWFTLGISMIGACVMIQAQKVRLYLLQIYRSDNVFVPDALANILIIASVPFAFYLFGYTALSFLFLFSAVVNWFFYQLASTMSPISAGNNYTNTSTIIIPDWIRYNRWRMQALFVFLLCLPVFFQLDGSIFNVKDYIHADGALRFDTKGSLLLVPLPISVLACYIGLAFLLKYEAVKISIFFLLTLFLTMVFSTFVVSDTNNRFGLEKMIFLVQFILPAFALVLGNSYREPVENYLRIEVVVFLIVAIFVPIELIASWSQSSLILIPHVYWFSIYQHLQYVPVILTSFYFLSIPILSELIIGRKLLYVLAPFIGIYASASISTTASAIVIFGSMLNIILLRKHIGKSVYFLSGILIASFISYSGFLLSEYTYVQKYQSVLKIFTNKKFDTGWQAKEYITDKNNSEELSDKDIALARNLEKSFPNLGHRAFYWKYHIHGIIKNPVTLFFGNTKRPDRQTFPSAHNYYLDLVYNFGLISLFPFIFLIIYTLVKLFNLKRYRPLSLDMIVLTFIILFFIFIENALKVGFRQPYPGIIMFFLWGVLLAKLDAQIKLSLTGYSGTE